MFPVNSRRIINDWGDLIRDYNDDADGPYFDWFIRERKKLHNMKSTSTIPQPPLTVHTHHPACWGIHQTNLQVRDNQNGIVNAHLVHPASVYRKLKKIPEQARNDVNDEIEIASIIATHRLKQVTNANLLKLEVIVNKMVHDFMLQGLTDYKNKLQVALDTIVSEVLIPMSDRDNKTEGVNYMNLNLSHDVAMTEDNQRKSDGYYSPRATSTRQKMSPSQR